MEHILFMKKKNTYIELLRFLFCVIIFVHHSGALTGEGDVALLPNGAIAVEFFFIVSGFFAMAHIAKQETIEAPMCYSMKYTVDKLLKLLPYAAVSILTLYVLFATVLYEGTFDLASRLATFKYLPYELTFTTMSGVMPVDLVYLKNTPLWFVSSMFIALPIVMYLSLKAKDLFKGYLIWFGPAMLFALIKLRYGQLFSWGLTHGVIFCGTVRALADITLGFAAFYVVKYLNEKLSSKIWAKILGTVLEVLLLFAVLNFTKVEHETYDQILITYAMFLMVSLALSDCTYFSLASRLNIAPVIDYLGSLAMPIYCLHWTVYVFAANLFPGSDYKKGMLICFIVTFVVAVVLKSAISGIKKLFETKKAA